jgi:hypothetical protein
VNYTQKTTDTLREQMDHSVEIKVRGQQARRTMLRTRSMPTELRPLPQFVTRMPGQRSRARSNCQ